MLDISTLDFSKGSGLVTAVVQHAITGAVLMVGYMDAAAVAATIQRRRAVFYSRSKQRLWEKGETSGNYLDVVDLAVDCDRDCLLILAQPRGPACHRGTRTCFGEEPQTPAEKLAFLAELEGILQRRMTERPADSYTAGLFAQGAKRIAQKVGEEGVELALAGAGESDTAVIAEAADLLFHTLLLLKSRNIPLGAIVDELSARHAARV
ncbi:MAG: bifunctional phosphoribosyl-AMP cyclohydrolase/phosphoribosyl-ATP diphosphatase HisIE [Pseudomonadales bacterium]|nr:bifunctional phosphoribosyl-AMP cyclohydrolase/phosphoribosyl-ATP diphosphatase HisIE [Pseudomonadales bacterium]